MKKISCANFVLESERMGSTKLKCLKNIDRCGMKENLDGGEPIYVGFVTNRLPPTNDSKPK